MNIQDNIQDNINNPITSESIKKEILKQKQREWAKRYYENNKEKVKARNLEYIRSHPEQQKEKRKLYYQANTEFCLDKHRQYRDKDRERYNAMCLEKYKIRCETDPTYQDKLAQKKKEWFKQKRLQYIDKEIDLSIFPKKPGAPRKYGVKVNIEKGEEPI